MPVLDLHPENLRPLEVDGGLAVVVLDEDSNKTGSDPNLGTVHLLPHTDRQ